MKTSYQKLHRLYGSHWRVADALGISSRQYSRIRMGHCKPKRALEHLMDVLIKEGMILERKAKK